jgi:hypothetical protein
MTLTSLQQAVVSNRVAYVVVVAGMSLITACQPAADLDGDRSESSDPPSRAGDRLALDTSKGSGAASLGGGCVERPGCSIELDGDPPGVLQQQLGCGVNYTYSFGDRFEAAMGSFCIDSPANRQILHDHQRRGFFGGYCESCLGVPAGKIFVFWAIVEGPTCPSGCAPPPLPAPL